MKIIKALTQVDVGGIKLNLFNFGGIVSKGLYAALGAILSLVFTFLIVVWVALSIYAAIRIIASAGNPEGIESGLTTIKNIWAGIGMGLVFFLILSLVGVFFGFGSVYDWSNSLAQCGGSGGQFLFQAADGEKVQQFKDAGATQVFIGCCELNVSVPIIGSLPILNDDEWTVINVSSISWSSIPQSTINEVCPVNRLVTIQP